MTDDLTPVAGRVYRGDPYGDGHTKLLTVKRVWKRKDGTPSSCTLTYEAIGVGGSTLKAELNMTLPKDGKLYGYERVES